MEDIGVIEIDDLIVAVADRILDHVERSSFAVSGIKIDGVIAEPGLDGDIVVVAVILIGNVIVIGSRIDIRIRTGVEDGIIAVAAENAPIEPDNGIISSAGGDQTRYFDNGIIAAARIDIHVEHRVVSVDIIIALAQIDCRVICSAGDSIIAVSGINAKVIGVIQTDGIVAGARINRAVMSSRAVIIIVAVMPDDIVAVAGVNVYASVGFTFCQIQSVVTNRVSAAEGLNGDVRSVGVNDRIIFLGANDTRAADCVDDISHGSSFLSD